MREPLPPKGFSPEAVFGRQMIEWVKSLQPKKSPGTVTDVTTKGSHTRATSGNSDGGSGGTARARWG